MNLLVDNQLPLALTRFLAANGFDFRHVQDIGMDTTDDRAIWEYARAHGIGILTKDADFPLMADRQGIIPPQVFWVRLGGLVRNFGHGRTWRRAPRGMRDTAERMSRAHLDSGGRTHERGRLGNCRKTALLQAFTTVLPQLRALLDEGGRASRFASYQEPA